MSKEYSWVDVRERAATAFGGHYPDAAIEAELIEVFGERPAFVVDAIADVVKGYQAGRVHSPWLLLVKQIKRPDASLVVTDESDRERAVKTVQRWMLFAGLLFDRWQEVEQVLFAPPGETAPLEQLQAIELETRGNPGRYMYGGLLAAAVRRTERFGRQETPEALGSLRDFDSPELREQLKALYLEQRPRGLQGEREESERVARYLRDASRLRGESDWVGEEPPLAEGTAPA